LGHWSPPRTGESFEASQSHGNRIRAVHHGSDHGTADASYLSRKTSGTPTGAHNAANDAGTTLEVALIKQHAQLYDFDFQKPVPATNTILMALDVEAVEVTKQLSKIGIAYLDLAEARSIIRSRISHRETRNVHILIFFTFASTFTRLID